MEREEAWGEGFREWRRDETNVGMMRNQARSKYIPLSRTIRSSEW